MYKASSGPLLTLSNPGFYLGGIRSKDSSKSVVHRLRRDRKDTKPKNIFITIL